MHAVKFIAFFRRITVCMPLIPLFFCGCQNENEPHAPQPSNNAQAGNAVPSNPRDWLKTEPFFDHFAELNAPILATPESERAWPKYRKLLPALHEIDNWKNDSLTPGTGIWEEAEVFIAEHRTKIDEIVEISKLKTLGFLLGPNVGDEDSQAFGVPQRDIVGNPPLGNADLLAAPKLATTALLLNTAAKQAVARNEADNALKYYRAALDVCRQMEQVPSFAAQSITTAKYVEILSGIREVTQATPKLWTSEQLKQLQTSLQAAPLFPVADLIEFDAFRMVVDGVVHLRNDDSGVVGPLEKLGLALGELTNRLASTEEELEVLEDLKTKSIDEYSRPMYDRTGWSAYTTVKTSADSTRPKFFYPMLYPAIESAYYSIEMLHQERDATLTTISLLIHYQINNQWPRELSELEPAILSKLPLDRFDGKPFRYKNDTGEITLYSVSVNKVDDAGKSSPLKISSDMLQRITGPGHHAVLPSGDWILWKVTSKSP